jgi:hypothetical protein
MASAKARINVVNGAGRPRTCREGGVNASARGRPHIVFRDLLVLGRPRPLRRLASACRSGLTGATERRKTAGACGLKPAAGAGNRSI